MVLGMHNLTDVKCDEAVGGGLSLGIAYRPNGKICFTISGYDGQKGDTYYLSSTSGNNSLLVKKKEDDTCLFSIEQL